MHDYKDEKAQLKLRQRLNDETALVIKHCPFWSNELFSNIPFDKTKIFTRVPELYVSDIFQQNGGTFVQFNCQWKTNQNFYILTDVGLPLINSPQRLKHDQFFTTLKHIYNTPTAELLLLPPNMSIEIASSEYTETEFKKYIKSFDKDTRWKRFVQIRRNEEQHIQK